MTIIHTIYIVDCFNYQLSNLYISKLPLRCYTGNSSVRRQKIASLNIKPKASASTARFYIALVIQRFWIKTQLQMKYTHIYHLYLVKGPKKNYFDEMWLYLWHRCRSKRCQKNKKVALVTVHVWTQKNKEKSGFQMVPENLWNNMINQTVMISSQSFCDSRNDYLSLSLSVCLSCYQSLYLGNYELDLDETWGKCWNLGPIDWIKIS